jgi:hypothetical protein
MKMSGQVRQGKSSPVLTDRKLCGPRGGLDVGAKRNISDPAANWTPAVHFADRTHTDLTWLTRHAYHDVRVVELGVFSTGNLTGVNYKRLLRNITELFPQITVY